MENLSLNGKVAIITGSSSGIGRTAAILFVRRGAKVTLHGRNATKLQQVADECKNVGANDSSICVVTGDLTTESCRQELVDNTIKHFGKLDILVNNAGRLLGEPLEGLTEGGLDTMMDLMFKAPIFLSKAALPHLKNTKGCIVNVSTTLTTENFPGFFSYTVAKHALDKFTEYAALEFRSAGIRVNSVKPGITDTNLFNEPFNGDNAQIKDFLEGQRNLTMLGCNAEPKDQAEMIAFLCSDAARNVSAHHFIVDGGRGKYFHH